MATTKSRAIYTVNGIRHSELGGFEFVCDSDKCYRVTFEDANLCWYGLRGKRVTRINSGVSNYVSHHNGFDDANLVETVIKRAIAYHYEGVFEWVECLAQIFSMVELNAMMTQSVHYAHQMEERFRDYSRYGVQVRDVARFARENGRFPTCYEVQGFTAYNQSIAYNRLVSAGVPAELAKYWVLSSEFKALTSSPSLENPYWFDYNRIDEEPTDPELCDYKTNLYQNISEPLAPICSAVFHGLWEPTKCSFMRAYLRCVELMLDFINQQTTTRAERVAAAFAKRQTLVPEGDFGVEGYRVVMPKQFTDLQEISNRMHNCVGQSTHYYENVAKGHEVIITITTEDSDEPLLCVEYFPKDRRFGQYLAKYNRKPNTVLASLREPLFDYLADIEF